MNEQDDIMPELEPMDEPTQDAVAIEEPAPIVEAIPEEAPMPEMNRAIHGSTIRAEAPVEPVIVQEPEPVAVAPVEPPKPMPQPQPVAVPTRHVVTDGDADPVHLSACVYENKFARKSLTVHHVQRRLVELGYNDAVGDRDGWYGELTALAVKAFQKDKGLDSTGLMNEETFTKLFQGDTNVEVILS